MIIAIDGPAGSGKSSTARAVSKRLGALYIDTGAMYRAVALQAIRTGISPEDQGFDSILSTASIDLKSSEGGIRVILNGEDVSEEIRSSAASDMSSRVSKRADVRKRLVELQRKMATDASEAGSAVVMEGRDIGTVVFPDADFKFYVTARAEVRAKRRALEMREKGEDVDEEALLLEIRERDNRDASRDISPLKKAPDAIVVDTSGLSFEEQVENILSRIRGNE